MKSKNATPENMIWKKKYNTRKYDITTKIKNTTTEEQLIDIETLIYLE
jgi:hypothetical protein